MFRSASLSCAILTAALALAARRMPRRPKARASPITPDRARQEQGQPRFERLGQRHAEHGGHQHLHGARRVQAGATGYGSLPPGIRKNLARGKPMPPGIAKKMVPGAMLARLPVHPGYEWRVAGSDLILVAIATSVVADVLSGVFD